MKRKLIALMIIVSVVVPIILAGCDEVEVHRESNPAPRTVQQHEVVTP